LQNAFFTAGMSRGWIVHIERMYASVLAENRQTAMPDSVSTHQRQFRHKSVNLDKVCVIVLQLKYQD
jgi:hypothetical protein